MNILNQILNHFNPADKDQRDRIAHELHINREALDKFEEAYRNSAIDTDTGNLFDYNSRHAAAFHKEHNPSPAPDDAEFQELIKRIVKELVDTTPTWSNYTEDTSVKFLPPACTDLTTAVTREEVATIPSRIRPQLTGTLMKIDIDAPSYVELVDLYQSMNQAKTREEKQQFYHMFRQGLDILDLDPILYKMLGQNRNNMSYWLPPLSAAALQQDFFKIPKTRIAKVPMPILQLTRLDYQELTPTTLDIVNQWAMKVFDLDPEKSYFIKTGIFSSKFDFRNAKVTSPKEVKELGEYLIFIQNQASAMAGPLSTPCIYGAATTNEFVVREFIEDKENNPTIYKGLPLHTEYRVFIDCDSDEVLGIAPYWHPDLMLKRFSEHAETSPHDYHDYVIYKAHEETLMARYHANKDMIVEKIQEMLPHIDLTGQWSLDIMQNGDDFWLIDMGSAANSALNDCVPKEKLKPSPENWMPQLTE